MEGHDNTVLYDCCELYGHEITGLFTTNHYMEDGRGPHCLDAWLVKGVNLPPCVTRLSNYLGDSQLGYIINNPH